MTRAVEESGCGPPDALSSVAVTFRTYSRPWSFGRGVERRRINPAKKKEQRPIKLQVTKEPASALHFAVTFVTKRDVTAAAALSGDG